MAKFELTKTIEAQRLNPRTGIPTTEPPVTIPYGAVIEDITPDRDMDKFRYLLQPFQCLHEVLEPAITPVQQKGSKPAAPKPAAVSQAPAPPEPDEADPRLEWETLNSDVACQRAKVPGGWLVAGDSGAIAFYPDAKHDWDGGSLP